MIDTCTRETLDSDGLHGQERQVVDQPDFLLYEGLAVTHACQKTVVARFRKRSFANLFLRDEELAGCFLIRVLRFVSHERTVALVYKICDIDDETGAHVGVEAGVDDLERTIRLCPGLNRRQAGEKACLISQSCRDCVVGMARLPVRQDDYARTNTTQNVDNLLPVVESVFDCAVGQVECIAPAYAQQSGSLGSFAAAIFRGATASGFTSRQIENRSAKAARGHAQQGSAAGLLHIIAMRRNGQHIGGGSVSTSGRGHVDQ